MSEREQLTRIEDLSHSKATTKREDSPGRGKEFDLAAAAGTRSTDPRASEAHAATLRQATSEQTVAAHRGLVQQSLLRLQRTHGNRHVQRVMALARKADGAGEVEPDVESAIDRARGGGQSLDAPVRRKMEAAFGTSFDGVRIHADGQADRLNHAVNALAFTTGSDIFFRSGQYQPTSSSGQQLLAHELTHVVQQGGSRVQGKLVVGPADDPFEQEADHMADAVMRQTEDPGHLAQPAASFEANAKAVAQLQRAPKTQNITFSDDEGVSIVAGTSPDIDAFFNTFLPKVQATGNSFMTAMQAFHDSMEFPPNKKAEPDFKDVFLDQLGDIVKMGYEKTLKPVLEEELPGVGQAASLVAGIYKEVQRAKGVAGQLAIRDFIIQTRNAFGDAITSQVDQFVKNFATSKAQAQDAWKNTTSDKEREAITGPMNQFRSQPTPLANDFQRDIVSAYIRSEQDKTEDLLFHDIRSLGRIRVKYDDDGSFESATVELQSGSGSDQVADQINSLYRTPVDLRQLNVRIEVGVYGELSAGGTGYYYATLDPPSFTPYADMPSAIDRFRALAGDPLKVPKVSG